MKKRQKVQTMLFILLGMLIIPTVFAITPNQFDNFENGTTQAWGSGTNNPNPPLNISSGGPLGLNDKYLLLTSNGGAGAGSKLVTINSSQWSGDYSSAGVQYISMYVKNFGNTTLSLRIVLQGPGGNFWSANAAIISALSDWQVVSFSVQPSDLTGGVNINSTLSGVTSVRILHSVSGGFTGDPNIAQIGLDNITAAAQPVTEIMVTIDQPDKFSLMQNYPNPFNPVTTIEYVLQEKNNAILTLVNAIGEEVAVLVNEEQDKGYHKVEFDGNNLSSGIYLYRLRAGNFSETKKMLLMK